MPTSFNIVSDKQITPNTRFLRIEAVNMSVTLKEIFVSLMDISWLKQFKDTPLYDCFLDRVNPTLETIQRDFQSGNITTVDSNAGEKVVSELARQAVVGHLGYFDIPLSELFKEQKGQNPGFDFLSMNKSLVLMFGEAKYRGDKYAYRESLNQIERFIGEKKDSKDIANFVYFIPYQDHPEPYNNFNNGVRGYMAAFSERQMTDQEEEDKMKELDSFQSLQRCHELICIAVNV